MRIEAVTPEQFSDWRRLRESLYSGLDEAFHGNEMAWIHGSPELAAFLAWSEAGEAVGLLELSLRNIVDGCIGGPVGYIEGIYLDPGYRGAGRGRALVDFAAQWARSRGCTALATDAEIDNDDAQAFFRHGGFIEGWRTVGFRRPLR